MRNILRILLCAFATLAFGQTTTVTVNTTTKVTQPAVGTFTMDGASNFGIYRGTGSPNGAVTASPGSLYLDLGGGLYVKTTGTGNTGWTAPGGGVVDDTAFASSWNGVTTIAPSKNAVYDWGHTFDTNDNGKVNVLDLGAGIPKTNSSGLLSLAVAGTDYEPPLGNPSTNGYVLSSTTGGV